MADTTEIQVGFDTSEWNFVFPVNPEQITIEMGSKTVTFSALRTGDYALPAGWTPEAVSFDVLLPGPARRFYLPMPLAFPPSPTDPTTGLPIAFPADQIPLPTQPVFPCPPDEYVDPQTLIHNLQKAIRESPRQRAWLSCADLDLQSWYIVQQVREMHSGYAGDVMLSLAFTEERVPTVNIVSAVQQGGGSVGAVAPAEGRAGWSDSPPAPTDPATGAAADDGAPKPGKAYRVQEGDTLASIAARAYGDPSKADAIFQATPSLVDPDVLEPGQLVILPKL